MYKLHGEHMTEKLKPIYFSLCQDNETKTSLFIFYCVTL